MFFLSFWPLRDLILRNFYSEEVNSCNVKNPRWTFCSNELELERIGLKHEPSFLMFYHWSLTRVKHEKHEESEHLTCSESRAEASNLPLEMPEPEWPKKALAQQHWIWQKPLDLNKVSRKTLCSFQLHKMTLKKHQTECQGQFFTNHITRNHEKAFNTPFTSLSQVLFKPSPLFIVTKIGRYNPFCSNF